jgi:hypothetical protein
VPTESLFLPSICVSISLEEFTRAKSPADGEPEKEGKCRLLEVQSSVFN